MVETAEDVTEFEIEVQENKLGGDIASFGIFFLTLAMVGGLIMGISSSFIDKEYNRIIKATGSQVESWAVSQPVQSQELYSGTMEYKSLVNNLPVSTINLGILPSEVLHGSVVYVDGPEQKGICVVDRDREGFSFYDFDKKQITETEHCPS